jgi:hypothetical protein
LNGLSQVHRAPGADSHPRWIGRTLVVGVDPHDVRRHYEYEGALPPPPEPIAGGTRRFGLRRLFEAISG